MSSITTLNDIETAIGNLTTQECDELRRWLDQYSQPQPIDLQLKADLDAGRLDDLINRALADHKAGRTQPL